MTELELRDVVVRYGNVIAVNEVSFAMAAGEILALVGGSGSGKSSLLRAIAGLEPLAGGTVTLRGQDLADVPVHRRNIGMMFQDAQLFPHLNVEKNVGYGLRHMSRVERRRRVTQLLELVGLAGYEKRRVTTLSGGQSQRVALARSLAPEPAVLLLDEPLSALDRGLRERLVEELRQGLRATGTTSIYVTHDQDEAFAVADRVAVLDAGEIQQIDTPLRLWKHPASKKVAAFLGFGPFLTPEAAIRLGMPSGLISDRELAGIGPSGLVLAPAGQGVDVPIRDQHYRRGYVQVEVTLLDSQPATLRADDWLPGGTARVQLDPDGCVVVPD